jgi:pimeloyl-ACP methyl ester carboxylesterase
MTIPSINYGGSGNPLLFLHANGYPPDCYRPLLSKLAQTYHVLGMVQRPLWSESNPEDIEDWRPLTDDLLRYLDSNYSTKVYCVGHSMGGIALLRAALREPDRFSYIVLLDPVLFPPYFIRKWKISFKLGIGELAHPFIKSARNRRQHFNDLERLYNGYRRKSVFRYFDDEALLAYIEGISCKSESGGYQLCYSAEWETRIYVTSVWPDMDIWRALPMLSIPTLILRGEESDTFWERTGKLVQRKQPEVRLAALEKSTHLVPLERPKEVARLISSFISDKNIEVLP